MIGRTVLLQECKRLLLKLEDDIRAETKAVAERIQGLRSEHKKLRDEGRTAASFETWLDAKITQAAASWILACVFVRYMEDNGLLLEPFIAGPAQTDEDNSHETSRLQQAQARRSTYFSEHTADSDREYLQHVFREIGSIPACRDLFAEDRNPLWMLPVSGDGGAMLVEFFQEVDPDSGMLKRDFVTERSDDTRFLGDLYQDLSDDAKKNYALLQTPEFVESFILDYTLEPAVETFGLRDFRLIDPACGSGHFLLGAFRRLLHKWEQNAGAGEHAEDVVRSALAAVHGVDINPFAVAIARFRLLVAALAACGRKQIMDVPAFDLNLAVGDSLLMGVESRVGGELQFEQDTINRPDWLTEGEYQVATRILSGRYHAVVGNPPYITCKDAATRESVREIYPTCYGKYALTVPFIERFFNLAMDDEPGRSSPGYLGMIAGNNFTKREFGKKLIEEYLANRDLTHVIDTSGAYIPGHGTPTVILFGRNRRHSNQAVRAVLSIRGEPGPPEDPANGKVWSSIVENVDRPGTETDWVGVADLARETIGKHPWSLQGGGASDLRDHVESVCDCALLSLVDEIGVFGMTNADDVMLAPKESFNRKAVEDAVIKSLILGDELREWTETPETHSIFPYDVSGDLLEINRYRGLYRWLWPCREVLLARATFNGGTYRSEGLPWWKWHQVATDRLRPPLTITFAFVATHNHFVLDRGGKVFKQSAPVIKLPSEATEDEHLWLLGLLNSSTLNFWCRQVFYPKGGDKKGDGSRTSDEFWMDRLEYPGTQLGKAPITDSLRPSVTAIARRLDEYAAALRTHSPNERCRRFVPTRTLLEDCRVKSTKVHESMVACQEELDWLVYGAYGLLKTEECPRLLEGRLDELPPIKLGQRAFEIVLARRIAEGIEKTAWFERHASTPITELPAEWPAEYQSLVERRIKLIEEHPFVRLLERPEHKRRWQTEPWDRQVERALYNWLCDRLEDRRLWPDEPTLVSCGQLADRVRQDADFVQVAQIYRGHDTFDLAALVEELAEAEAVPYLPSQRYTPNGLRKRKEWEQTWELQRREDAGEQVDIPVPPRYTTADFQSPVFWRRRGRLDVPKERFISYPGAQRGSDGALVITWAGYDHLQQAKALAAHYVIAKDDEGWPAERLVPLLAGLDQLVPWLKQWHNEVDPNFGERMGDFYETFVEDEARGLGKTIEDLRVLQPLKARPRGRRKK